MFRRMGRVAGEAALIGSHGGMGEGDRCPLFAMAVEAEGITLPDEQLRVVRGMGHMAGKAHAALKGLVLHGPA